MVLVSMSGPKTPASKLLSENVELDQNIAVFVRCRPIKAGEKKNVVEVIPEQKSIRVHDRGNAASVLGNDKLYSKIFSFDSVFGPNTEQIDVYKSVVAPLIDQVIAGYNCTVFAYGQTGTGKTFTMEGERTGDDFSWEEDPLSGMIPRALHQLFETLPENTEHTIGVSFIELYNEELYDLLSAVDDTSKLKIYDDPMRKGSVIISGLEEINVHTKAQIYEILRKGSEKRQTASTLLNACSSRSHTIFSVTIHIKENSIDGEELLKIGKLNLVDLAGSENIGRSGASEKRAREAGNINQSLLTLGRVITCLTEKAPHIPYRESKLTRLLKDSLGGRTKTSIIATISPNVLDAEDTLSTLEYAQRAKRITNKPEVNQKLSKKTLLREYTAEIERLRRDLLACREKNGFYISETNYNELLEKNDRQAKEIEQKVSEIDALQEDLERISKMFVETKDELEKNEEKLEQTCKSLKVTEQNLKVTETNLNEHTYLLDIHSKNEQVLYSQAQELLTFADKSSKDLSNLFRKVECQKKLEDTNFSRIELFQENFNAQMEHFLQLLDVGTESLSECLSTIKPHLHNGFSLLAENVNEILSVLATTGKSVENHCNDFEFAFKNDQFAVEKVASNKEIVSCLDESKTLYREKLQQEMVATRELFEKRLTKVSEIINTQRSDMETLLLKQSKHMKELSELRNNYVQNIRTMMSGYFEAHNSEILALKREIENLKVTQKEFSIAKAAKMSQIGQLLVELSECEKKSVSVTDGHTDNVSSVVNKMVQHMEKERETLSNIVNESSVNFDTREKAALQLIDDVDSLNALNIQGNICELDSIIVETKPQFQKMNKVLFDMSEDIHCNIDESVKVCDEIIASMNCNLKEKESVLSEMKSEVAENVSSANNASETTLSNIGNIKENALRSVSMSLNEAKNWSLSYKRELISRSSDFDIFKSSDLTRYKPTGTTPQKFDAKYPQNLSVTSPNDALLSRFRKLMNEKDASQVPLPDNDEIETTLVANDCANLQNKPPSITDVLHTSHDECKKVSMDKKEQKSEKLHAARKPLNEVSLN